MIDLKPFCYPGEDYECIHKPWYEPSTNLTIAMDRRVLVVAYGRLPDAIDRPADMPQQIPMSALKDYAECPMRPLGALPAPNIVKCDWCNGTGIDPEVEETECGECGGDKQYEQPTPVRIGAATYSSIYLRLLSALPGLVFEDDPAPALPGQKHPKPGRFRFDGGHGLLMPMRDVEGKASA